jgi:predicted small secreted protein
VINFKKVISVVVVFSLVLSSCGGNKNGGSGVSGLGRNVQLSIFENDIETVRVAEDVVQVGSTIKLVGNRFEKCDLDSATGETVCVNKGSTSTVRFKSMKYDDNLLEGKDLQCAIEGGGEGCGAPLLVRCESQEERGEVCVSPEIRFYGTRMAVSSEQKKAAKEKKEKDKAEWAGKYEKIKGATIDEGVDKALSIVEHCSLGNARQKKWQ